jgi:hypothetical protein
MRNCWDPLVTTLVSTMAYSMDEIDPAGRVARPAANNIGGAVAESQQY